MAYKFGSRSKKNLLTTHPKLQSLFTEVILHVDCAILCGVRDRNDQNRLYYEGRSQLVWPNSKHNKVPSFAVDVVPWHVEEPHIRWDDLGSFYMFGGYVHAIADMLKIEVVWGGEWKSFRDMPHWEVVLHEYKEPTKINPIDVQGEATV